MTQIAVSQLGFYLLIILILAKPLGWYIAQIYSGNKSFLHKPLAPLERFLLRCCQQSNKQEMNWLQYLAAMLLFNLFGLLAVYAIQRLQYFLPLNPQNMIAVNPDLAFNTASSFVSNTNWQSYTGEATLSYFSQMVALTVQNFLSAATGMSLLVAFSRGLVRHEANGLGNFWVDTIRGVVYILLPLSFVLAMVLCSQGVIQNFKDYEKVQLISPISYIQDNGKTVQINTQTIPMGPVASQVAIKQLGSNGGGYFAANSAHPFENPNIVTNLLEMVAILLIPAALCYSFGILIKDRRQGWMILITMLLIFVPLCWIAMQAEQQPNLVFNQLSSAHNVNMEGKELRIGVTTSALWGAATTAVANGSVNGMLDSFSPIASFVLLFFMHLGEIVFGGVGSGMYGMLMMIIITVFVSGLMVGRTPEYLGKKIEPFEMKMAVVAVLVTPLLVLVCTAIACLVQDGSAVVGNPGAHGFSEILYAFTSYGANNGSAFVGLNSNNTFYNTLGGILMLITRYWIAIAVLAVAGSLARKKLIPVSNGTLATHTLLFIILLTSVIFTVGALSFLPSLALGPIADQVMLWGQHAK